MEHEIVLTMRGICMEYPGVKALDHVDFTLRKGEIHALMGENGAGKSTLIKCLTGINDFRAGEIHVDGVDGPVKTTPLWMRSEWGFPPCIRRSTSAPT